MAKKWKPGGTLTVPSGLAPTPNPARSKGGTASSFPSPPRSPLVGLAAQQGIYPGALPTSTGGSTPPIDTQTPPTVGNPGNGTVSKGGTAKPPSAPAAPSATPQGQSLSGTPEVRDSPYFSAIATNNFNRGQKLGQIATAKGRLDDDTKTSLAQLAHNLVMTKGNISENENRSNLFGSGHMIGLDNEADYQAKQRTDAATLAQTRGDSDYDSQRSYEIGMYGDPNNPDDHGLAGAQLFGDAGQRWIEQHPNGLPANTAIDSKGNPVPIGPYDSVDGKPSLAASAKGGRLVPDPGTGHGKVIPLVASPGGPPAGTTAGAGTPSKGGKASPKPSPGRSKGGTVK